MPPPEIQNRIDEISFNAALLRELRAIEFVQRLIEAGSIRPGAMKKLRVHMIADDDLMNELSAATKLVPLPTVLAQLKAAGRAAADLFLTEHGADVGAITHRIRHLALRSSHVIYHVVLHPILCEFVAGGNGVSVAAPQAPRALSSRWPTCGFVVNGRMDPGRGQLAHRCRLPFWSRGRRDGQARV